MKQASAILVLIMLSTASAIPSHWSEYYSRTQNALYRNSGQVQQAGQQCSAGEVPASIACQSARLTTGGRYSFVHVCPGISK